MFSSLLSRPENSQYIKPVRLQRSKTNKNKKVLLFTSSDPNFNSNPQLVQSNPIENDQPNTNLVEPSKGNSLSKYRLNEDGTLNYSLTVLSADGTNRKFHTSYEDTIPLKKRYPNLKHHFPKYTLETCPNESIKECLESTKGAINRILQQKLGATSKSDDTTVVNYTSDNVIGDDNERGRTTQIQIKNYQQDPMLPPKHKLRKNRPTEPSPPPPILKNSKPEKLTKEEQDKWKIPSVISNWKNNQGFTISLENRMLAATSNETPEVNVEKLADLSSALESADRQARDDIKARNDLRQQMIEKQQKEKEAKLQELAELTRAQKNNKRKFHHNSYHDSNNNNNNNNNNKRNKY